MNVFPNKFSSILTRTLMLNFLLFSVFLYHFIFVWESLCVMTLHFQHGLFVCLCVGEYLGFVFVVEIILSFENLWLFLNEYENENKPLFHLDLVEIGVQIIFMWREM